MIPTWRLVAILCVAGVLMAASGVWAAMFSASLAAIALLTVLTLVDWQRLRGARLEVVRSCDEKLSLGAANAVCLSLRNNGYSRLAGLIRDEHPEGTTADSNVMPLDLPPRSERELVYHVTPLRRGNYDFGDTFVRIRGHLGLLVRQIRFSTSRPVKVYPNLLDIRRYEIGLKRETAVQAGHRASRTRGIGTDFESLRDYTPDDEFRAIDWKATARRGKLISRQYQEEKSQNILVLLDCGRITGPVVGGLTRLDHSINAAVMLAHVAAVKGDRVGLMAFADDVRAFLPPRSGRSQVLRLLGVTYNLRDSEGDSDYTRAVSYLASRWTRRSLVVFFTDLVDPESSIPLIAQIAQLARRHLCVCVTVSDPAVLSAAEDAYQAAAAREAIQARKLAAARVAAAGAIVVDAIPGEFTPSVVNAYLKTKTHGRL